MKRIKKFLMVLLMLFSMSSCNKPVSDKFMLKANIENQTLIQLENNSLKEKIINEESFVLVILLNGCSSCLSFKENVINPFINETKSTIYSIDSLLLDQSEQYENKPTYKVAPSILIYKKGKLENIKAYKADDKTFSDLDSFKEYLYTYTIQPKMIELSEQFTDSKIANNDSFILYVGWYRCGDCISLNDEVITSYLKEKDITIYYLESDKYRSVKPLEEPILSTNPTDEEIIAKQNWDNWINFTSKYGFNTYRNGRVPSLIYFENGIAKEFIVYRNDVVVENVVVDSYYSELIGTNKSSEELTQYHNQKVIEFLNKYC